VGGSKDAIAAAERRELYCSTDRSRSDHISSARVVAGRGSRRRIGRGEFWFPNHTSPRLAANVMAPSHCHGGSWCRWRARSRVGCCPTIARPTARPETSHSLGLPDLPDLSWHRETSSSGERRRLGDTPATASFASLPQDWSGRSGRSGS
jgi:hypothetical protein